MVEVVGECILVPKGKSKRRGKKRPSCSRGWKDLTIRSEDRYDRGPYSITYNLEKDLEGDF